MAPADALGMLQLARHFTDAAEPLADGPLEGTGEE